MNSIRKLEYEIKSYHDYYRALKKLHTFRIQKAVRKIKKAESHKQELETSNEPQPKIDASDREIQRCLKQKEKLDQISKFQLRLFTIYNLEENYMIVLENAKEFFEKELPGFSEKLAAMKEENSEDMKTWKWFEPLIKDHKNFKELDERLLTSITIVQKAQAKKLAKRDKEKIKK